MNFCCHLTIACILFFQLMSLDCHAKESSYSPEPVVGLALSGGAAKGFAHVGVLKVLEEEGVPVQILSGTSIGSIIGGMYAAGYSAKWIEQELLSLDWNRIFNDVPNRSELLLEDKEQFDRYIVTLPVKNRRVTLPSGLYEGQRLTELLGRLAWPVQGLKDFDQLPIRFGTLATNLENGEARLIRTGGLQEAMRASMAIPTAFTPWEIDGELLVDGLLVRNLPAEDAREMGADFLIGVDVSSPLYTKDKLTGILNIFEQSISIPASKANSEQLKLCDVVIKPEVEDVNLTDFRKVQTFIERGEIAARKALPAIREALRKETISQRAMQIATPSLDAVHEIKSLEVEGLMNLEKEYVLHESGLQAPGAIRWKDVEGAIHRLYNTSFFDVVTYRIEGDQLILVVREKNPASVGVGLRYDSEQRASVFANLTARNVGFRNSRTSVDLKLGIENRFRLESTFFNFANRQWRTGVRSTFKYRELDYKSTEQNTGRRNENEYDHFYTEVMFATIRGRATGLGVGVMAEVLTRIEDSLKLPNERQSTEDFGFVMHWRKDTLNKTQFPDRGEFAEFKLIGVNSNSYANSDYRWMWGVWQRFFELHPRLALGAGWKFSRLNGSDTPMHRNAFLGGFEPFRNPGGFIGLRWRDRYASNMNAAQLSLHYRLKPDMMIQIRHNEGNVDNDSSSLYSRSNWIRGTGVSLIKDTQAGPLEIGFSRSTVERFYSWVALGFRF